MYVGREDGLPRLLKCNFSYSYLSDQADTFVAMTPVH